jgi:E-phenylitaconyl-CoA hydratase
VTIKYEVDEGIATITMDRPERLNALDADMYQGLSEAWRNVRDDDRVRVAVVTGAGDKSFTTGADLKSFVPSSAELSEFWMTQKGELLNRGLEVWKPVVAAVNGYCLGGGMTLLLATDIRVAATHASFGLTEVKRGLLPGNGGTQRLLRQVPFAVGMELLLTGDSISAEVAERWGLVNAVVEADKLLDVAYSYAQRIACNGPLATQAIKELALRSADVDLSTGLRIEQAMGRVLKFTEDAKEGPAAFAERRSPDFKGR